LVCCCIRCYASLFEQETVSLQGEVLELAQANHFPHLTHLELLIPELLQNEIAIIIPALKSLRLIIYAVPQKYSIPVPSLEEQQKYAMPADVMHVAAERGVDVAAKLLLLDKFNVDLW